MGYVYCFRVGSEDTFKVGRTKNPPAQRMKNVSVGSPQKLTLHRQVETNAASSLEKYIHWLLDPHRAPNGEFFHVSVKELDRAIGEAESFLAESFPVLQEAKKLQKQRPTTHMLDPSESVKALHRELRTAERQAFLLEKRIETLRCRIQVEIGENLGIRGVASWKWREQWMLDQKALKRDEPHVYERFKRLSEFRVFHLE
jgi:Meiotically Up-regulated Gene 113 (MUG113) protein